MPKGRSGERRASDAVGLPVVLVEVATESAKNAGLSTTNRHNVVVVGAKARMKNTDASSRHEIAAVAATARWRKENDMTDQLSARTRLSALYAAKRDAGLIDVKFLVGNLDEASFDAVANEVLRLEEAIERKAFKVIRFNDKR
jgi:hypothetical protein